MGVPYLFTNKSAALEDGANRYFWNVGAFLPYYTTSLHTPDLTEPRASLRYRIF